MFFLKFINYNFIKRKQKFIIIRIRISKKIIKMFFLKIVLKEYKNL